MKNETSFAALVKGEMANHLYRKAHCRRAELLGLLRMGANLTLSFGKGVGLEFMTESAAVARKALMLLKGASEVQTTVSVIRSFRLRKANRYDVRVVPSRALRLLLHELGLTGTALLDATGDDALLRRPCCRLAYLRGAFLAGGSVSRPAAGYHLELVTAQTTFAELLLELCRNLGFPANLTDRKEHFVIYLKESEAIIDFLAMLGAERAASEVEVARNVREVKNQVNRLVNCETANLTKTARASALQAGSIAYLKRSGRFTTLPLALQETATLRLEHPEASLSELAATLRLSKSAVNHRLRKLKALAKGG